MEPRSARRGNRRGSNPGQDPHRLTDCTPSWENTRKKKSTSSPRSLRSNLCGQVDFFASEADAREADEVLRVYTEAQRRWKRARAAALHRGRCLAVHRLQAIVQPVPKDS